MGQSQTRPGVGSQPDVSGDLETLRYLLEVEKARLEVALRIEKARNIVFPETSVIVHDIERLMKAVSDAEKKKAPRSAFSRRK